MAKLPDRYMEERRQEILDAARRVFVEKGYDAATINDIAAAADVSAGSIYRYFENKRDLIAAAANACVDDDLELWSEDMPDDITAEGRADECVLRLESYLACYRDPELREHIAPKMEESTRILEGFIRRAQESGELDPSIDPERFARFLHVFGAGVGAHTVLYGPEFDTDSVWNQLISLVSTWFTGDLRSLVQQRMGETDQ